MLAPVPLWLMVFTFGFSLMPLFFSSLYRIFSLWMVFRPGLYVFGEFLLDVLHHYVIMAIASLSSYLADWRVLRPGHTQAADSIVGLLGFERISFLKPRFCVAFGTGSGWICAFAFGWMEGWTVGLPLHWLFREGKIQSSGCSITMLDSQRVVTKEYILRICMVFPCIC